MIDISTDDGLREAMKEIASWEAPTVEPDTRAPYEAAPREPAAAPGARLLAAAAILVLVLVAGAVAGVWTRDGGEPVAAARGQWRTMAEFPLSPRFEPATLWTGAEFVVWGGYDRDGVEVVDGAAYDPSTDEWRTIADLPFDHVRRTGDPVGQPGMWTSFDVEGAWLAGEAYFAVASDEEGPVWDILTYDPALDAWRMVARTPFQGVEALAVADGRLTVVGWRSETSSVGWAHLDPTTGAWSEVEEVPASGELAGFAPIGGATKVDDRLVVLRGGPVDRLVPMGFLLDPVNGDVTHVELPEDLPFDGATAGLWGELTSDGLLVGIASSDDGELARVAYHLDPSSGAWTAVAPPPSGPTDGDHLASVVDVTGGALLLGGLERDGTDGGLRSRPAALATDADGSRWTSLPDAPIELDRVGHLAVWTGEEVLVWGGATGDGSRNLPTVPLADGAIYEPGG